MTQFDIHLWKAWWRIGGITVFFVALVGTVVVTIAAAFVSASRSPSTSPRLHSLPRSPRSLSFP